MKENEENIKKKDELKQDSNDAESNSENQKTQEKEVVEIKKKTDKTDILEKNSTETPTTTENPQENSTEDEQTLYTAEDRSQVKDYWFVALAGCVIICSSISVVSTLNTMTCWRSSRKSNAQIVDRSLEEAETSRDMSRLMDNQCLFIFK